MRTIKLHYPKATVIEATLRGHLPPKPGDIVLVFDPYSTYISNITILAAVYPDNDIGHQFAAPVAPGEPRIYRWTYAYKVPEGYASVETTND